MTDNKQDIPALNATEDAHEVTDMKEEGACAYLLNDMDKNESLNILAPEFVPQNSNKVKSYAEAVNAEGTAEKNAEVTLCPYVNKYGVCRNMAHCTYLHGELCDMCSKRILHPYNEEQRKIHIQVSIFNQLFNI